MKDTPPPDREALLKQAAKPSADALRLHPFYRGKVQVLPKCPVRGIEDFAVWYTPGVAAPCKAIHADPDAAYEHTNKGNSVAIVSDGTRVLGLGDIGPLAGLPVMEGKALLFKYLGGVDAVPLCIDAHDPGEIVRIVRALAPSFGGVNLEDIAQPKCFRVLDALRSSTTIPVWHDDQQGSATIVLAGLQAALRVVRKDLRRVRIAMIGMGAANVAVYRLLRASGADIASIVACDSQGTLHSGRTDIAARQDDYSDKWRVCTETNGARIAGGIAEALRGADVCIAFSQSGPGIIRPDWIRTMAKDAIVFACANPVPEIWPWEAQEGGARIVATGRSDFPNQVNNSLAFPGIFRGVLDVRAHTITDGMALAAAAELVRCAEARGLRADAILPTMDDLDVAASVAAATGMAAQAEGVAKLEIDRERLYEEASARIAAARKATEVLMREGLIAPPPAAATGA
jgi:malate dehydrogenase (oxaloacetate-decarboxylating)